MPLFDNDGTTSYEIGKLYDNDGTTSYQIGKAWDYDGTTSYLVYEAAWHLFNAGYQNEVSTYNKTGEGTYTVSDTGSAISLKAKASSTSAGRAHIWLTPVSASGYTELHIKLKASIASATAYLRIKNGDYNNSEENQLGYISGIQNYDGDYSIDISDIDTLSLAFVAIEESTATEIFIEISEIYLS